jgi:hypothetical protein
MYVVLAGSGTSIWKCDVWVREFYMIAILKSGFASLTQMLSVVFVCVYPTWLQIIPSSDVKSFEFLGAGALVVIVLYYVVQLVKVLKAPRGSGDAQDRLIIVLERMEVALAMMTKDHERSLAKLQDISNKADKHWEELFEMRQAQKVIIDGLDRQQKLIADKLDRMGH